MSKVSKHDCIHNKWIPQSTKMRIRIHHQYVYNNDSTADTCKNCAKCGKGFKIGTNEAYNIKIKIRLRGISKIFCFCSHANTAASDKGISLKKKFLKNFYLTSRIKCNHWKELTKLVQNDLGIILTG